MATSALWNECGTDLEFALPRVAVALSFLCCPQPGAWGKGDTSTTPQFLPGPHLVKGTPAESFWEILTQRHEVGEGQDTAPLLWVKGGL